MLDVEEFVTISKNNKKKMDDLNKKYEDIRREELKKQGIEMIEIKDNKASHHGDCDSVYTMEDGSANLLYVLAMVVGAIFYDRWLIWILSTVIWLCHIFRHDLRKIKNNKKFLVCEKNIRKKLFKK